jgi:signal transduction histidine kinase
MRLLAPFRSADTYRAALYYLVQLLLGVAGFTLLCAGWPVTLCFAITPLVVVLLVGLRLGVGLLARAQASVARDLLGARARTPLSTPASGFWNSGFAVLRDPAFWKQQAHLLLAWPVALVPLALLSVAGQLVSLPIWYRWVDSADAFGLWEVDSFAEAVPALALGLVLLVAVAHLLGPLSSLSRRLATALLGTGEPPATRPRHEIRARRLRALTIVSLVATSIVAFLTLIWALTTPDGYFWPIWPLLGLSLAVGIPGAVLLVLEHPTPARLVGGSKALAIQIVVSAVLLGFLVAVWAITTHGYFWPAWPALGLGLAAAVHAAVVYARDHHRIEILEATRAGAVEVQESELRRIERDLHDGAQARLVALGMSLGLAEQALEQDPDAVRELLADARRGAREALEELRVLARGIRPPILTDRGLEPAISALVARTPLPVTLSIDLNGRYVAAIETAVYFTVAEALANAIKHANAAKVDIRVVDGDGVVVAEVVDDGDGGADPRGSGLTGLRQRAEALDGTLRVVSPEGGPTSVRVELPCG